MGVFLNWDPPKNIKKYSVTGKVYLGIDSPIIIKPRFSILGTLNVYKYYIWGFTFCTGDPGQVCQSQGEEFTCPTTNLTCDRTRCPLQGPSLAPIMGPTGWSIIMLWFHEVIFKVSALMKVKQAATFRDLWYYMGYLGDIFGISLGYLGDTLGLSCGYLQDILGIS